MVVRLVMHIMGTFLLTYTTSPISLTDGLESRTPPVNAAFPANLPAFRHIGNRSTHSVRALKKTLNYLVPKMRSPASPRPGTM